MTRVEPAAALVGDIAVPAVKGICQRGALLAAIADGESELRNFGHAADTDSALAAVAALGAEVAEPELGTVRIGGRGLRGLVPPATPIDCGNAGTVLRLLSGILAGQDGRFELVGDESLSSRPVRVDVPLRQMGARVETNEGRPPVTIEGARLQPIRYELPVASAQLKSAVLLAGLLAEDGPTTVVERTPSRDHTERLLRSLGLQLTRAGMEIRVWPAERIPPFSLDIPGDFSSAAPFVVAATLLSGSNLRIHDVDVNPTRTGLLDVLGRMGGRIAVFNRRSSNGEPVADLEVRSAPLLATAIEAEEVPRLVDELPLFALLASQARGESVVKGAQELRVKETDRIETVTNSLRALGVRISASDDGFRIRGVPTRPRGGAMASSGDHRLAMLGAVAGAVSKEGVEIEDAEAVAVSFPGFFELLESVTQR
ncbi:MAG: 3-phosphoshikimate 1-carboxyvinyltransferase [Actinobacteria bacterium 13_2_20CM_68_14]|nr:MAG: 3-phosphoshikimate 1-carboxyvinyltransferase [Actinobacteria bacterium 13_2_20CM_68_14]